MTEEQRVKSIEYAKNYPIATNDGNFTAVSVSSVREHNGKVFVNLCMKTQKSGELGAAITFPVEWAAAGKYRQGDLVDVIVADGYVKKIAFTRMTSLKSIAAKVNEQITNTQDEKAAEKLASDLIAASKEEATVTTPELEIAGADGSEDLPF